MHPLCINWTSQKSEHQTAWLHRQLTGLPLLGFSDILRIPTPPPRLRNWPSPAWFDPCCSSLTSFPCGSINFDTLSLAHKRWRTLPKPQQRLKQYRLSLLRRPMFSDESRFHKPNAEWRLESKFGRCGHAGTTLTKPRKPHFSYVGDRTIRETRKVRESWFTKFCESDCVVWTDRWSRRLASHRALT